MHSDQESEDWEPSFPGELRPLDAYTVSEFTCGGCGAFASALHDRTGWSIMAEYEGNGDVAHVWVLNDEGKAVDIHGVHPSSRARTRWSPEDPGPIAPMSRADAADRDEGPGSHFEWAVELLDAHPERFGLPGPGAQLRV